MTRDEFIKLLEDNSDAVSSNGKLTISRTSKEEIAQKILDFQELAVIEGRISECDEQLGFNYTLIKHNENTPYGKDFCSAIHAVNAKALFNRTKLEITRTELLTKLNLEG